MIGNFTYLAIGGFVIASLAIVAMGVSIIMCIRLLGKVPGGVVKKRLTIFLILLVFFFIGYLVSPFFYFLQQFEYLLLLVYLIFFFGAIFVMITIGTFATILSFIGVSQSDD